MFSRYSLDRSERSSGKILFRILVVLALIAYCLFAPRQLEEIPGFRLVWSTDVVQGTPLMNSDDAAVPGSEADVPEWIPFVTEDEFGYLSGDGRLLYRETILFDVAVSDSSFVNYSRMGESLVARTPRDHYFYGVNADGYPVYREGELFLISHDRMSIIAVGEAGDRAYRLDFPSIVTSFDYSSGIVAVGLLDGSVELFSSEGKSIDTLKPQEKNRPVYGVAISRRGTFISCIWGDEPQHTSVYRVKEEDFREVERFTEDEVMVRETLVRFSADEKLLFYERQGAVAVVDLTRMERRHIPVRGRIFDLYSEGKGHPLFVAGNGTGVGFISVFDDRGELLTEERLPAGVTYFYPHGNGIVCTAGGRAFFINGEWI